MNFHGEARSNDTHQSTTDPEARLYKKSKGSEAKLSYLGHGLMENRNGEAWTKLSELPAGSRSYTDPQSAASGQASYRVYALNKAGRSAYSNIARVTP